MTTGLPVTVDNDVRALTVAEQWFGAGWACPTSPWSPWAPGSAAGWRWHPADNAWLCNSLYGHYEFTASPTHLEKIHPLLKGAREFWEARLLTISLPGTSREVLVADSDWSPEHGPLDAKGVQAMADSVDLNSVDLNSLDRARH